MTIQIVKAKATAERATIAGTAWVRAPVAPEREAAPSLPLAATPGHSKQNKISDNCLRTNCARAERAEAAAAGMAAFKQVERNGGREDRQEKSQTSGRGPGGAEREEPDGADQFAGGQKPGERPRQPFRSSEIDQCGARAGGIAQLRQGRHQKNGRQQITGKEKAQSHRKHRYDAARTAITCRKNRFSTN